MQILEKTQKRQTVFKGKIFTVEKTQNLLPDGNTAYRERIIHTGGAGVLALDDDKNVTLVRQYRCGVERIMTEIPAGKTEKGEDPLACAVRELKEELGFTAKNIISLGSIAATPAYDSEIIYIYLATDLQKGNPKLDEGEFVETVTMPLSEAVSLVQKGVITDAKTQIALLKAERIVSGEN